MTFILRILLFGGLRSKTCATKLNWRIYQTHYRDIMTSQNANESMFSEWVCQVLKVLLDCATSFLPHLEPLNWHISEIKKCDNVRLLFPIASLSKDNWTHTQKPPRLCITMLLGGEVLGRKTAESPPAHRLAPMERARTVWLKRHRNMIDWHRFNWTQYNKSCRPAPMERARTQRPHGRKYDHTQKPNRRVHPNRNSWYNYSRLCWAD
jgi:hypothetical protein